MYMMFLQTIKKCLAALFMLSTLIGTIKAGNGLPKLEDKTLAPQPSLIRTIQSDEERANMQYITQPPQQSLIETIKSGEESSKVQDITQPTQQGNTNEVHFETLVQTGASVEEWCGWIFDGKEPQYQTQPGEPVPSRPDKYNEKNHTKPHQA